MAEHSAEEARKKYEALPPEVKNLLYSPEMSFTIQQIGQKNGLHIDQIDSLNTEVGQVMLGFVSPQEFASELMEMLNLDQAKAQAVAQDVDSMLFSKIRGSMKASYEAAKAEPAPTAPATPIAVRTPPQPLASVLPKSTPQTMPATTPPPPPPVKPIPPPSAPVPPPIPPKPVQTATSEMHQAETMLSQKTVEVAPAASAAPKPPVVPAPTVKPEPPKPGAYKADPYREPVE
jgi:hypothetical protein